MACIHREKLKCSRLRCQPLSKAVIYGLATPSHQICCRGWVPLSSCLAGQAGTSLVSQLPWGTSWAGGLDHCHWYFSLRWRLAEGLHRRRSQIPSTILPLQHIDHFYSPVNNHFVSYLVLKLFSLLKGTIVEDYFKISARTVHIFPLKNCKTAEDQSFNPSSSACISWKEKGSTAGGWIYWASNCNSLKQLRAAKWLLLLR